MREKALKWWNSLSYNQKKEYTGYNTRYSSIDSPVDPVLFVDDETIEEIWKKKNPIEALSDEMINIDFDGIEEEHLIKPNILENLEEKVLYLEEIVNDSLIIIMDGNLDENFDESLSPYYDMLCQARKELEYFKTNN